MLSISENTFCYGCGVCATSCKAGAIKIIKSTDGFWVPKINESLCTNCTICDKVCTFYNENFRTNQQVLGVFSAYSNDTQTRHSCTSGGFAHELSKLALDNDFKVVGVEYDYNEHIAKHKIANDIEQIDSFKGSKYIQSYTNEALQQIFDRTNKETKYLIVGSPCQIAAIRELSKLKKIDKNHLYVDFFCHGVPSYLLWEGYLRYSKKKYSLGDISKVAFRDKKFGWHSFTFVLGDGKREITSQFTNNNLFYSFFLYNLCLNKACYEHCKFKNESSSADIRIGDLWGTKYASNDQGVSGIMVYSDKGLDFVKKLSVCATITEETIETVTESQLKKQLVRPPQWEEVMKDLREQKQLDNLYAKYIRPIKRKKLIKRIINKIRKTIKI